MNTYYEQQVRAAEEPEARKRIFPNPFKFTDGLLTGRSPRTIGLRFIHAHRAGMRRLRQQQKHSQIHEQPHEEEPELNIAPRGVSRWSQ
jgi:hypothetical protein